jgi:hypothetical protein
MERNINTSYELPVKRFYKLLFKKIMIVLDSHNVDRKL